MIRMFWQRFLHSGDLLYLRGLMKIIGPYERHRECAPDTLEFIRIAGIDYREYRNVDDAYDAAAYEVGLVRLHKDEVPRKRESGVAGEGERINAILRTILASL